MSISACETVGANRTAFGAGTPDGRACGLDGGTKFISSSRSLKNRV